MSYSQTQAKQAFKNQKKKKNKRTLLLHGIEDKVRRQTYAFAINDLGQDAMDFQDVKIQTSYWLMTFKRKSPRKWAHL